MGKYKTIFPQCHIYMYTSMHPQCYTPARFVYNSKQQQLQQQAAAAAAAAAAVI